MWRAGISRAERIAIAIAAILVLTPQSALAQCTPASPCVAGPQDVGTLGGTFSNPAFLYGLSSDGQVVVGIANTPGGTYHAFRWQGGSIVDLGTLGGDYSVATAVDANGQVVVGYAATTGNASYHAVRWDGIVITDLGTLGDTYSFASAVDAVRHNQAKRPLRLNIAPPAQV